MPCLFSGQFLLKCPCCLQIKQLAKFVPPADRNHIRKYNTAGIKYPKCLQWMHEDYHSQWAWGTWKESVQIHHSYSKISSNFPRFCQGSSSDYGPAPCKASKSGEKKLVLLYFSSKLKQSTSNGTISYETNGHKKKHLETPLINTQCSQLTRACGSRKLPVHHIITNQHCTCLPKSSIDSLHLASMC